MNFELDFSWPPLVIGVVCLALAVLTLVSGRRLPGFSRLFLVIALAEVGVLVLTFGAPADSPATPEQQVSSSGVGDNIFPGVGGEVEDRSGPSLSPERSRSDDDAVSLNPGLSVTSPTIGGFGDVNVLAPHSIGFGSSAEAGRNRGGPPIGGGTFFPKGLDYFKTVFVLDISGSMYGARYNRLVRDLEERLLGFEDEMPFAIILFNEKAVLLPGESQARWHKKSTQTVADVVAGLKTIQPAGGTAPFGALEMALGLKPRMILLLTDGEFNEVDFPGVKNKVDAAQQTKMRAAKQHTRIHGIFISEPSSRESDVDIKSVITNSKNFNKVNP